MASKPAQLRQLLAAGCVPMPGAFNALTARLIEQVGFPAVYVSGAGLTNATCGVPDIGLIGLDEFAKLAGYIAAAVNVPVVCDADTGFGGPANAARTVQLYERAGLAGMHIEDQEFPKRCGHLAGKDVIACDEMVAKIKAAVAVKNDKDFLIIARTDARAVEGFDAAVERAKRYVAAGADAIFPEAMESADEFAAFAKAMQGSGVSGQGSAGQSELRTLNPQPYLMANMTEFGKGELIPLADLAAMGYRMVIYPQTALRVMMKSAEACLHDLKQTGTQAPWLDRMQTRKELYDLLKYDPTAETWP